MGRIGSGVRVSASFQIFALRMLLHFAWRGLAAGICSIGLIFGGNANVSMSPWNQLMYILSNTHLQTLLCAVSSNEDILSFITTSSLAIAETARVTIRSVIAVVRLGLTQTVLVILFHTS